MTVQLPAKPGFAAVKHCATRVFLALLLVIGMFGVNRTVPGASQREPVSEGQHEETESTKEAGIQALGKRRARFEGTPPGRIVASPGTLRTLLEPRGVELPRPTWERPRRSLPTGDGGDGEDDELG